MTTSLEASRQHAPLERVGAAVGCPLNALCCGIVLGALALAPTRGAADEGGVSFWMLGQHGSFAAVAPDPGWSSPMFYYHYAGDIGERVSLPRGHLLSLGLGGAFDGLFIVPTYTLDTTVLGGRPSFSVAFAPAYSSASDNMRIGQLSTTRADSLFGGSDLYPTAQLYWNTGVHNFMVYAAGDIPVGSYNPDRLANIGIGHGAIDGGGAYTYLNPKTGMEASATLGFTRNFQNPSTGYTNGIDAHLELGASQFLSEKFSVGVVGYYYQQLTADTGQSPILGPQESRVRGVGPQIGYNFDLGGGRTAYTNLRGYTEFGAQSRVQGYAIYATVVLPLSALLKGH